MVSDSEGGIAKTINNQSNSLLNQTT